MAGTTFIDTGYILALLNSADQFHQRARLASQLVQPPFVTTEAVLIEIGNALSRQRWRALAIATISDLHSDPDITVVPVDSGLFQRALRLYGQRADKDWGLTDCISFVAMQEHGIAQVITTDQHFVQAGFISLLFTLPD